MVFTTSHRVRFQSTLPHGERRSCPARLLPLRCFNPRSHTGSDTGSLLTNLMPLRFQSTLPHGERLDGFRGEVNTIYVSIHAPTRGATRTTATTRGTSIRFNPRSHTGSDEKDNDGSVIYRVFQSTLPHGERHNVVMRFRARSSFNPRSHTGSDSRQSTTLTSKDSFNPRSHTGSDLDGFDVFRLFAVSIHAPTRGATI